MRLWILPVISLCELRSTLCTKTPLYVAYELVRTSSKYRWSIYRTSGKCRWNIYRTSRKRRGTLRVVHKAERSSPTVVILIRSHYSKQPRHTRNPHKSTKLNVVTCSAIWYEAQQQCCRITGNILKRTYVICVPYYVYMTRLICIHVYLIVYTCKIIMYTCVHNYVYMQDNYVNMQDNYAYMQDIYVNMQDICVYMYTQLCIHARWLCIHAYLIMYTCKIIMYT